MESPIADIAKQARSFAWRNGGIPTVGGYVIPTAAYPKFKKAMKKHNKKLAKKFRKFVRHYNERYGPDIFWGPPGLGKTTNLHKK